MATLKNVGKTVATDTANPAQSKDVVDVDYINALLAANLSQATVTARITANLAGFATQSFANTTITGLATPAYVTNAANAFVPLTLIGQVNGPTALSGLGRVSPAVVQAASTQTWPSPLWSPATYLTTALSTDNPLQLYTMAQPYPGYPYVLECTGIMDTQVPLTDNTSCIPQVLIRQGSATGPIIAFGYGIGESYSWGTAPLGVQSNAQLGAGTEWAQYYNTTSFGNFCTATANIASWGPPPSGVGNATCRARCLDPVFGKTTTSYQQVSITIDSSVAATNLTSNDIYIRMDDTGTYYVRCRMTISDVTLWYSLGGSETQIGATVTGTTMQAGDVFMLMAGNYSTTNLRQFMLYQIRAGTSKLLATWNDTNNATAVGSPYLGWGFGASTSYTSFFFFTNQVYPSTVNTVTVADPANPATGINSSTAVVVPAPLAGQTAQTGPTTLYVMLQSSDQSAAIKQVTATPINAGLAVLPLPWAS